LSANAVVSGVVVTREGDPVQGKQVSLLYRNWAKGEREWFARDRARTDDRGEFRIAGAAPGRYLLSAGEVESTATDAPQDQPANIKETLVTTYFPGTSDINAATFLTLGAGMEMAGLKIEMQREPVFTLRVAARDEMGDLVPGAALAIRTRSQTATAVTTAATRPTRSADGYHVFRNLAAGEYIIQARPGPQRVNPDGTNPAAPPMYGRLEIKITDRDVDDAVIRLTPNILAIDVNVTVEDGQEAALRAAQPVLFVSEPEIPGMNNRFFRLLPNGWYRADSVARSVYGVRLSPLPENMYIKSVRFGGQDVTRSPLELTNAAGGAIDIVVSGKAAGVSGVVRNEKGEPVGAVAVALWPKTPDRSNLWGGAVAALTDANGAFRLTNLAPGDYYLAGWEQIETSQAESVAFRAFFTGQAEEIEVDEGGNLTRDIKPISAAEAERRVAEMR
jgi:protocatechuate 3,4-dioxygenase beta subunit